MAGSAEDLRRGPVLEVANPDEDCSPEEFASLLVQVLAGPEPTLDSLGAAEALRELRSDSPR